MPYLAITTNVPLEGDAADRLMHEASTLLAESLGKPERYVMVSLRPNTPMLFGGEPASTAHLDLRSIGLPESATPALSQKLCQLMQRMLSITADRVFINFADVPRALWGWNGRTF
ncbi:MAG: hypothetical protein GVY13_07130 [Alphaproteobacteria bacterium]|jgi:phenylpyruvate tautomerase PptA (4-oxalocrotonate tautomerase family)|nr:hypothetical protein [Alphaproteobacteria bacterium]